MKNAYPHSSPTGLYQDRRRDPAAAPSERPLPIIHSTSWTAAAFRLRQTLPFPSDAVSAPRRDCQPEDIARPDRSNERVHHGERQQPIKTEVGAAFCSDLSEDRGGLDWRGRQY